MNFEEQPPNENYPLYRLRSVPLGLWELGVMPMLLGAFNVRAGRVGTGLCVLDYRSGVGSENAMLLCGWIRHAMRHLPEKTTQHEVYKLFPRRPDGVFWQDKHAIRALLELSDQPPDV